MSTDVTIHDPSANLHAQMEFARTVTTQPERGGQSLLPEAYRGNPANVLIAVGLGEAMGLSYAESLYRISVIKGKPSAAAELIAANVRKAGHKLRIRVTEEPPQAVCTIIRADDPDEPVVISRDMKWAQRMGLANEPNYKKQPATMLSYRAITAAARLACPEALYGVTYTPDEAESVDSDSRPVAVKKAGTDALRAAVAEPETVDAEVVEDQPEPKLSAGKQRKLFALFGAKGIPEHEQASGMAALIGREVTSRTAITDEEFEIVVGRLESLPDKADEAPVDELPLDAEQ